MQEVSYAKGYNQTANFRPRIWLYQDGGRRDLFFHRNELEGVEFASLREGQEVEFEVGRGRDGRTGNSSREGGKSYPMSTM